MDNGVVQLPTLLIMGLLSENLEVRLHRVALPKLNFQKVHGPFALSVSLRFWASLSGHCS
jgi:hypothetical protein